MTRALVGLSMVLITAVARGELILVKDGKSDYVIVTAPNPIPAEQRGASELQSYIKQMSGAELPIVANPKPMPAHAIITGPGPASLGSEGFQIKTVGQRVAVLGGRPRGTMYGCTTFLEKLGVRFFTPKVTRVPKMAT